MRARCRSTVFPDWLNPNTSVWWENELRLWIGDDLALSGLWIDMNEYVARAACRADALHEDRD